MDENILCMKEVVKDYFMKRAVDGISLTVQKGRILGMLGPNGSGKSTTLKMIAGLTRASSGSITVCGMKTGYAAKQKIAYLPELDYIYPWMTVKQSIGFISSFYPDWDYRKTNELIGFMKLNENDNIKKLSKGMRAKLKIIIALSRKAPLLLLDEPLSGIDYPTRARIIEAIVSQYREDDQSVILSTHEVPDSEAVFDDVVFLENGRIKMSGTADDFRVKYGKSIAELMREVYPA
jgi:ABC-2 type transport system ATP-binding protein